MSAASAILEPKMAASGQRCEDGVPDMTAISDIDVAGVNTNLRVRFERNEIYTFTGTILVVRISKRKECALNFNSIWFSVCRFPFSIRAPHPMHHSFHCAIVVVLPEPKNIAAPADLLLTIVQMTLTFKQTNTICAGHQPIRVPSNLRERHDDDVQREEDGRSATARLRYCRGK